MGRANVGSNSSALPAAAFDLGKSSLGASRNRQHAIGVAQSRVRHRVTGIFVEGLIEVGDRRCHPLGALVPFVAAFQVQLVGLGILRALLSDLLFFRPAHIERSLPAMSPAICCCIAMMSAPCRCSAVPRFRCCPDVGEFGAYLDGIAVRHHAPGDQRGHAQFFAHLLHVDIFAFVAKDRVPRFHFQLGHVRQIVDQRFGDAVAQVVGFGIAADVGERQHRQRIDLRRLGALAHGRARPATQHGRRAQQRATKDAAYAMPARRCTAFCRGGRIAGQPRGDRICRFRIALQPLQVGAHIGRALVAQVAIFLQRLADDALKLRRRIGNQCAGGSGSSSQNRAEDVPRGRAIERQLPVAIS